VWPAIQKDCRTWARAYQPCQRSKVSRHTITPVGNFPLPPARFYHIHIDLVGPLPSSAGFQYCLTAVDRFTRCPEAFPIPDTTAETVSRALLSGWISRFVCPKIITTDQGRQFESQLFHSLVKMCGIQLRRTTPKHPAANGLVERLHRTMKAAIICHADEKWTEALPLVLLGIRTACKEDLQSSAAELVYGEPLRVPGELLVPSAPKVETSVFIQQLRRHMDQLRTTPAARHASPATFVHKDLRDSTHVFLRQDAIRQALEPPYSGPHKVIARTDKILKIHVRGRQVTVSADRVKPAYKLEGTQHDTSSHQPSPAALQQNQSHQLSLQGLHAPSALYASPFGSPPKLFPPPGGGGRVWEHPHDSTSPSSLRFSSQSTLTSSRGRIKPRRASSEESRGNSRTRHSKRGIPASHIKGESSLFIRRSNCRWYYRRSKFVCLTPKE
jgi:transposase InsO family protein